MLIDNKDKAVVGENDIDKLVRDARERSIPVAVLVARSEDQLRQVDRETRWSRKDGVWILRTTRQWLPRDLDVLKPLFERMRLQGSDFLEKNAAVADEVRRTFADLDRIESELKKAAKAISSASGLVAKYREQIAGTLRECCRKENADWMRTVHSEDRLVRIEIEHGAVIADDEGRLWRVLEVSDEGLFLLMLPERRGYSPHPNPKVAGFCGVWVRPKIPVMCFFRSSPRA